VVRHRLAKPWSGLESPRTFDSCILRETLSLGLGRALWPEYVKKSRRFPHLPVRAAAISKEVGPVRALSA
jgi:hypothetical protein